MTTLLLGTRLPAHLLDVVVLSPDSVAVLGSTGSGCSAVADDLQQALGAGRVEEVCAGTPADVDRALNHPVTLIRAAATRR